VLESRHVIGLFLLMLLFSGVFFTLGYVMGRSQYDGQVRASSDSRSALDDFALKHGANSKRSPGKVQPQPTQQAQPADNSSGDPATAPPPNSDWEFYKAGQPKTTEDHLKPPESAASRKTMPAISKSEAPVKPVPASAKSASPPLKTVTSITAGGFTLQVAALTKESDAFDLARRLQAKKFPASVLSPQGDKYFRVQVGPYHDQKSADAAKKGLEAAGFKAFVKH
jgi:cell division septation protein DedD